MDSNSGESPKTISILVENLKETLKSIDLSILLAFTAVAFVSLHGLEGSFTREITERVNRAAQERAAGSTINAEKAEPRARETDVPLLGFKAELVSAALVAMIGYWVLCFIAGFRMRRAREIASRLAKIDKEVLSAALLYPSLATSGRTAKVASCIALGVFGCASAFSIYFPLNALIGKDTIETIIGTAVMLIPAAYVGCELWLGVGSRRTSSRRNQGIEPTP